MRRPRSELDGWAARTRWLAVAAWSLWALNIPGMVAVARIDRLLRQVGRPELAHLVPRNTPLLVAVASAASVGLLLASRRPRHPVGWLLLALGLAITIDMLAFVYLSYALETRPGAPTTTLVGGYVTSSYTPWLACAGFVLLLTPTGTLPSRRWRWWARVAATAPVVAVTAGMLVPVTLTPEGDVGVNPFGLPALLAVALVVVGLVGVAVVIVGLVVAASSLVVRFRRARGVERQQLRWLALAVPLVVAALLAGVTAAALGSYGLTFTMLGCAVALPPLATGAAIQRYRLYDLDRIVSRTLAYALLTVLLGGAYAGLVLGLGQLLGQDSSLVVAGATLAVAGVFQPARRRVQDAVDRRFNRRRYDAARTIQAFGARLRQEVDLDGLTAELLAVVEQTMQPTRAAVWLRPARPPATTSNTAQR